MAEITPDQLPWSSEDESHWLSFIQTDTGKRLLPKLAEQAPLLLDGSNIHQTLVRSGELRGFQAAIQILLSLTHSPPLPPPPTNAYPPLETDEGWEGEKLNPENK